MVVYFFAMATVILGFKFTNGNVREKGIQS